MADVTDLAARLTHLAERVTRQHVEIQALRARPGPPDTRLGQPPMFDGNESSYDSWSFKLKAYMGHTSPATLHKMMQVEVMTDALDMSQYDGPTTELATSLFYKLAMFTDSCSYDRASGEQQ